MVTEKDICVLASHLRDAGCNDVALAMEMALFSDDSVSLGEDAECTETESIHPSDVALGSVSLNIPRISFETKEKYKVIASSLLANADIGVRREARKLLKALS